MKCLAMDIMDIIYNKMLESDSSDLATSDLSPSSIVQDCFLFLAILLFKQNTKFYWSRKNQHNNIISNRDAREGICF